MSPFASSRILSRGFLGALVLLVALGVAAPTTAQIGSGQIVGVVQDPAGAVIPGARVTVRHVATGSERQVTTNEVGQYGALNLRPGEYEVTVEMSGFGTLKRTGIILQVGSTATVNITLQVAVVAEVITVTEDAPITEPDRTEYSALVSQEAVENLPINGRRWENFVLLTPTVQPDGNYGLVSYRGISGLYNNNMVDGADNNQAFFSEARGRTRVVYTTSQAAIKEFQVGLSNYSAEFGRAAGGTVNAVTKSGSNTFHGEAFYFIRDDAFNAQEPINKAQGYDQLPERRQQFGFSMGGPIAQDKLFWFLNYDQQHRNFPGLAVDDLLLTDSNGNLFTDSAFDVSEICDFATVGQARCEGARQLILDELGPFDRKALNNVALGKLDWNISDKHTLGGQYNFHKWRSPNGIQTQDRTNDTPPASGYDGVRTDMMLVRLNSITSTTTLNEFRFQYARDFEFQRQNAPGPSVDHTRELDIDGYGMRNFLPREAFPDEDRFQWIDNFSWIKGRHLVKVGADINYVKEREVNLYQGGGEYEYRSFEAFAMDVPLDGIPVYPDGANTSRHYQDFVQAFDLLTGGIGEIKFDTTDWNFYVQDTWKVHPHLTLNLGVRYEYTDLPQPDQSIFGCVSAGTCPDFASLPSNLQQSAQSLNQDKNNFGPRVALAWDVGGQQKFIIRTGYGLYYGRTSNSALAAGLYESNAITRTSLYFRPYYAGAPDFPDTFCTPALGTVGQESTCTPPTGITGSTTFALFSDDYARPLIHSGEFELEYALSPSMSVSASYLMSRGQRLPAFVDINLPDPSDTVTLVDGSSGATLATLPFYAGSRPISAFSTVILSESVVNSWYNALVLRFKRRFSQGLQFDAHYTWSKALDDGQGSTTFFAFYSERVDPQNRALEYGRSNFDRRHKFTSHFYWDPPFENIANDSVRAAFEGFLFSGIVSLRSGPALPGDISISLPYSAYLGWGAPSSYSANGTGADDRAPWLGRNYAEGTGFATFDLRITREFRFGERMKAVFLWEAFNLFNRTNFTWFIDDAFYGDGSCTQAGFGAPCDPGSRIITVTPRAGFLNPTAASNTLAGPREMQFGFKFIW
jgi:hypothetical protein